jgi:hypothetical protein
MEGIDVVSMMSMMHPIKEKSEVLKSVTKRDWRWKFSSKRETYVETILTSGLASHSVRRPDDAAGSVEEDDFRGLLWSMDVGPLEVLVGPSLYGTGTRSLLGAYRTSCMYSTVLSTVQLDLPVGTKIGRCH